MWQSDNDYPRQGLRTWYCQDCSKPVRSEDISANRTCKCGGKRFALQPKLHTPKSDIDGWTLSDADVSFLRCQRIKPE
jgi:DNA-directed RNA polymerase subunit RPC12/RpoP